MVCFVGVLAKEAIYPKTKANDNDCCLEVCSQLCLVKKPLCNAENSTEGTTNILLSKAFKGISDKLALTQGRGFFFIKN